MIEWEAVGSSIRYLVRMWTTLGPPGPGWCRGQNVQGKAASGHFPWKIVLGRVADRLFCLENRFGHPAQGHFPRKMLKATRPVVILQRVCSFGRVAKGLFLRKSLDWTAVLRQFLAEMGIGRVADADSRCKTEIGRVTFSIFHRK